jgi:hypothetical protein
MWPQNEMVAMVLVKERERRLERSERLRVMQDEAEHGFANGPFRPAGLLLAMALLAAVGRMILI